MNIGYTTPQKNKTFFDAINISKIVTQHMYISKLLVRKKIMKMPF